MSIKGVEGMTVDQLNMELQRGGKFVVFQYCISVVVLTFRRNSSIYFVRAEDNAPSKGISYTLLSLLLGWWGIPWGPIFTIAAIANNLRGGKDVTQEVIASLNQPAATRGNTHHD